MPILLLLCCMLCRAFRILLLDKKILVSREWVSLISKHSESLAGKCHQKRTQKPLVSFVQNGKMKLRTQAGTLLWLELLMEKKRYCPRPRTIAFPASLILVVNNFELSDSWKTCSLQLYMWFHASTLYPLMVILWCRRFFQRTRSFGS